MAASARRSKALGTSEPFYAKATTSLLAGEPAAPVAKQPTKQQANEWETLYGHHENRMQALYTWRVPWWTTHGQIARYELPRRWYYFVDANLYNQGLRQDFAIVDRTATLAGEVCAAGLMSTLTDPDRNWLDLGPAIPNLELDKAGQMYYEDVTERLNYVYDHSNFYDAQAQHYEDLTFFGTGCSIDYESADTVLNVFSPCAGEFMLANNFDNGAQTMYREFRMTVSEMMDMFGAENLPPDALEMWREKGGAIDYQNVIGHAIEPNFAIQSPGGLDESGVVPGGFTWRETYWVRGKKDLRPLSLTGFHDQPFGASVWTKQGNDPYGRGVGENMLGDCIQLQLETRQKAESIEKVNRPPMGADVALMNQPSSTQPGKITYMNTGAGGEKKFFPLYEIKPDIAAISADIQMIQERIRTTAYNDVFQRLMTLRQQMKLKADLTATEVEQLTEEAFMRLGPMIFRVYSTMRQRVRRHLAIMARRGLLPRKPDSLRNVPLGIEFVSLLTEARRGVATQSIARTLQFVGSVSGAWPEAVHKVDINKAIDRFAKGVGTPADIIRTDKDVAKLVAQAQKNQAMQQAMQATLPGAQAAKALSETKLAPGTALSALVPTQGPAAGG